MVFFSRRRQKLWHKGETSGNYLHVVRIMLDCDRDCLTIEARSEQGITCHLGKKSCFFRVFEEDRWIEES